MFECAHLKSTVSGSVQANKHTHMHMQSRQNWGQVYIRWSVIVSVNYIIHHLGAFALAPKSLQASYL